MKTYALAITVALSAVLMLAGSADAKRWAYHPAAIYRPAPRVIVAPRVAVRPVAPVVAPYSTTIVTPTAKPAFVVGPHGRLHYVGPTRRVVAAPVVVW